MNEITGSMKDAIKNRFTNALYGTFIISWAIFHWNFLYALFFLSEEKIWESTHFLKNEYLIARYFNLTDWHFYFLWVASFVLTWIMIWKLPKWLLIDAYKETEEYETAKIIIKINKDKQIEKERIQLEEATTKRVAAVTKKTEKVKELKEIDPIVGWQEEFSNVFQTDKDVQAIREGNRAVYETNGKFTTNPQNINRGYNTYIPSSSLSRLDALGLIKMMSEHRDVMEFTEKGKFFVRELQKKDML